MAKLNHKMGYKTNLDLIERNNMYNFNHFEFFYFIF